MTDDTPPAFRQNVDVAGIMKAFEAFSKAINEALAPIAETLNQAVNTPWFRTLAAAAQAQAHKPCHCLCGKIHPDEMGVCDMNAVTIRHYETQLFGPVDVPLCAPCAVAAGVAELAAAEG
jgi:hypothetical protein